MSRRGISPEKKWKAQREEKQEERRFRAKQSEKEAELRAAFNANGGDQDAFIETLISQDDLDPGTPETLQDATVAKINNLLSRDWVVANLTDAQEHDIRNKLEVLKLKVLGMHPPAESYNTGKLRAFLLDDRDERLEPLTPEERVLIDELFETIKARMTRGRGGFERELMRTNIARSETAVEEEDTDDGALRGLF